MNLSFNYWKDQITDAYVEGIPYFPTKKEALQIFKNLRNNLSSLSTLRDYKPKVAVIYYSVRGYKGGYKLVLSDLEIDTNRPFPDEPKGRFSGKRKAFKISEKELN